MSTTRRRRNKKKNQQGWETVTHTNKSQKQKYEWQQVVVPPEVIESLTPLEDAFYRLLLESREPLTSEEIVAQCGERCAPSDISNVVYDGRLKGYIEAASVRPHRWRLQLIKVYDEIE